MPKFRAVYEANIVAPNLRAAKKQLSEIFEFGVTPREVCEEMVSGLERVPDPCKHRIAVCAGCGVAAPNERTRLRAGAVKASTT
jgi:hypothetical protein